MQVTTEWKRGHIWDILATVQPHSLGTGDKCTPPCFRVLFGKVQQCSILRDQTTWDLKSHHLQDGSQLYLCPHLFFQQDMNFFKGTHSLFGGHVPLRPPWVRHCHCYHLHHGCIMNVIMICTLCLHEFRRLETVLL